MKTQRKHMLPILFCIMAILCLVLSFKSSRFATAATKDVAYIIDGADIYTDEEEASLNSLATKYSNKWNTSIIVLTTDDTGDVDSTKYANDYYDNYIHDSKDYNNNSIIFFIKMGVNDRECFIFTSKDADKRMSGSRSDKLLDSITPLLHKKDFYKATEKCLNKINYYLKVKPGMDPESIFLKLWFQVILAVVIGGIIVGIMVANSGGRVTTNSSTYLDQSNSALTGQLDNYIRTTTKRVKKSSNNDNGGGGGSGTAGGGSSLSSSGSHKF